MANFQTPTGSKLSGKTVPVRTAEAEIGLWGFKDFNGTDLKVVAVDLTGSELPVNGVRTRAGKTVGDVQMWTVTSTVGAKVRLEARAADGSTWDWMELTFTGEARGGGTEADREAVLAAIKEGRIVGESAPLHAVCTKGFYETGKGPITLATPMFAVLAELADNSTINLMSLMRYGQGPHGRVQEDGSAICSAMDIQRYGQYAINLINGQGVDDTISGIAMVIGALPTGLYAVGLTRPSPHASGPPMPEKDVFLPVKTKADIYKVGFPKANPTAQFVLKKAGDAINQALLLNKDARIDRMFEDGPDHMHLEVLEAKRA